MSWLRRLVCWLFALVPEVDLTYANACIAAQNAEKEGLRLELHRVRLLNDPREHVSRECYAKLEERYDVLYREHQVLKERIDASDDEEKSQSAIPH